MRWSRRSRCGTADSASKLVSAFAAWQHEARLRVVCVDSRIHDEAWSGFAAEQGQGLSFADWTLALASREMAAPVLTFDAGFAT